MKEDGLLQTPKAIRDRRYRRRRAYMTHRVCDLCMGAHVTSRCTFAASTLALARTPGLSGRQARPAVDTPEETAAA